MSVVWRARVGLFEFAHESKKWILQSELKTHAKTMKHMNKLICKSQNQKIMFH
jgi:hypothetical protein